MHLSVERPHSVAAEKLVVVIGKVTTPCSLMRMILDPVTRTAVTVQVVACHLQSLKRIDAAASSVVQAPALVLHLNLLCRSCCSSDFANSFDSTKTSMDQIPTPMNLRTSPPQHFLHTHIQLLGHGDAIATDLSRLHHQNKRLRLTS